MAEVTSEDTSFKNCLAIVFGCSGLAIAIPLVLMLLFWGYIKFERQKGPYRVVPSGLAVEDVLEDAECHINSVGLGSVGLGMPGDESCGIVVYRINPNLSKKVKNGKLDFLRRFGSGKLSERNSYDSWQATSNQTNLSLVSFEYNDGPMITISKSFSEMLKSAVQTPGNYYAWRRRGGGFFIIIPDKDISMYVYY